MIKLSWTGYKVNITYKFFSFLMSLSGKDSYFQGLSSVTLCLSKLVLCVSEKQSGHSFSEFCGVGQHSTGRGLRFKGQMCTERGISTRLCALLSALLGLLTRRWAEVPGIWFRTLASFCSWDPSVIFCNRERGAPWGRNRPDLIWMHK